MPGACLMMSTSGPSRPLVISLSAPLRMTSARPRRSGPLHRRREARGDRQHRHEDDDDAGDADDGHGRRAEPLPGIVRRLSASTASVCLSHLSHDSATRHVLLSQRVGDPQPHGRRSPASRPPAGPSATISPTPIARSRGGSTKIGSRPPVGSPLLHEQPGQRQAEAAADERDEQRLGEHQRQDRAVRRTRAS